jgi:hypothetical protein
MRNIHLCGSNVQGGRRFHYDVAVASRALTLRCTGQGQPHHDKSSNSTCDILDHAEKGTIPQISVLASARRPENTQEKAGDSDSYDPNLTKAEASKWIDALKEELGIE